LLMPPPEPQIAPVAELPKKMSNSRASKLAFSRTYAEFRELALKVVTRFVPPTEVTCGLDSGKAMPTCIAPQGTGGALEKHAAAGMSLPPQSPEAATKVIPRELPSMKKSS